MVLGREEEPVHDMDRQSAWVPIKGGWPKAMALRLNDPRKKRTIKLWAIFLSGKFEPFGQDGSIGFITNGLSK